MHTRAMTRAQRLATLVIAIVLTLFAVFGPRPASAQSTATLSWTSATKNTDNTNIPATGTGSLTRTTIDYGTCTAAPVKTFNVKQNEIVVVPPANTSTVALVVIQEYCFRAWHTNTYGNTSAFSNVVAKANLPPTPGPPTNLVVIADALVAYGVQQSQGGGWSVFPAAEVFADTECDGSKSANGLYHVPESAVVRWYGDVRAPNLFAACAPSGG